jgi:hypothetical protein
MKALKWMAQVPRSNSQTSKLPSPLWFILALPSLVVFIAWPLSGLCLELISGFRHGQPGQGANVTGFVYSNFNANSGGRRMSRGSYIDARVLGHGAVYTPQDFDRSQSEFLQKVPVVLPNTESVKEIFLTAQGDTPIEGKAWGLLLHYDCKVADKLSDLNLLKDRKSSTEVWGNRLVIPGLTQTRLSRAVDEKSPCVDFSTFPLGPHTGLPDSDPTPLPLPSPAPESNDSDLPTLYYKRQAKYKSYRLNDNQTFVEISKEPSGDANGLWDEKNLKWSLNLDAVIETAYQSWPPPTPSEDEPPCGYPKSPRNPPTSYCHHHMHGNTADEYPGIQHMRTFEVLLWQRLDDVRRAGIDRTIIDVHDTIDRPIRELDGEYIDFYERNLTAIGVSCTSSSSVGSADIDGQRSTYSNLERSDTPMSARRNDCAKRFGAETLACTLDISKDGWLNWLFDSIGLPSPLDMSEGGDPEFICQDTMVNAQLELLQADKLRKVLLQAYSTYAIKLMYNDGRDFIAINGTRLKSHVPGLTAFVAGTVIESGVMPATVPVALFGLWALISSGLCLVYGFRRRWSVILDRHTVFRLGVDLQDSYRVKLQRHSTVAEIEECSALHEIPGFVSDVDFNADVGRIGLVEGKAARKDKFYN